MPSCRSPDSIPNGHRPPHLEILSQRENLHVSVRAAESGAHEKAAQGKAVCANMAGCVASTVRRWRCAGVWRGLAGGVWRCRGGQCGRAAVPVSCVTYEIKILIIAELWRFWSCLASASWTSATVLPPPERSSRCSADDSVLAAGSGRGRRRQWATVSGQKRPSSATRSKGVPHRGQAQEKGLRRWVSEGRGSCPFLKTEITSEVSAWVRTAARTGLR